MSSVEQPLVQPTFKMELYPQRELVFNYRVNEPCTVELKVHNSLKDRQVFKIGTTGRGILRANAAHWFVEPKETASVKITLRTKEVVQNNLHYLGIYHMKSNEYVRSARDVWTEEGEPEGVAQVKAYFELKVDSSLPSSPIAITAVTSPAEQAPEEVRIDPDVPAVEVDDEPGAHNEVGREGIAREEAPGVAKEEEKRVKRTMSEDQKRKMQEGRKASKALRQKMNMNLKQ